jgi:hypothetical protein
LIVFHVDASLIHILFRRTLHLVDLTEARPMN